jgi:hypothetical protein
VQLDEWVLQQGRLIGQVLRRPFIVSTQFMVATVQAALVRGSGLPRGMLLVTRMAALQAEDQMRDFNSSRECKIRFGNEDGLTRHISGVSEGLFEGLVVL